jgi:hypothetical protein
MSATGSVSSIARKVRLAILIILELIMAGELVLLIYEGLWLSVFLVAAIMLVTLGPIVFASRMPVQIPAEFHILAVVFVFVALFAFLFAVSVGALWEIFEFSMDRVFGTTMQKPMFQDPSGLTDTMWDLIVDTLGAFMISALGWWYMKRKVHSFVDVWIRRFIERNPRLFRSDTGA